MWAVPAKNQTRSRVMLPANIQIRNLGSDDLAPAVDLSTRAGWNQTADDWRMLFELAPHGCFGVEVDDFVAASATLLCYGDRLGWIGMVLTHPEFRHRGFARQLFEHVLAQADRLGVKTLKLDATDQGQHLYESYGFKSEQSIERWFAPGPVAGTKENARPEDEAWDELDEKAFGVDRSPLLRKLAARGICFRVPGAYALQRAGRTYSYLGPCVAENPEAAREVLAAAMSNRDTAGWFWDLLPSNRNAVALAGELGFSPQRRLVRMYRGDEFKGEDELVYAIAGFELG